VFGALKVYGFAEHSHFEEGKCKKSNSLEAGPKHF